MGHRGSNRRPDMNAIARPIATILACAIAGPVFAQPVKRPAGEAFIVEQDAAAARRLDDVREYIRKERWDEAADLLVRLPAERGAALVPVRRGWYANVARSCHLLAAAMPAKGLQAYRKKVDVRAATWLRDGLKSGNADLLRRVVREAFCSSSGDAALLTLGQWAWDRGDVDAARRWWRMLLPPEAGASAVHVLFYPDPDIPAAEVRARLILCDVMQRKLSRADKRLATFAKRHPNATGTIAGRKGELLAILKNVRKQAESWPPMRDREPLPTFAGNPARNGAATSRPEVVRRLWSRTLPWRRSLDAADQPRRWKWDAACFPVTYRGNLYVTDGHRIYGYRLSDGKPAFGGDANGGKSPEERAVLYSDLAVPKAPRPTEPCTGVPRFTLTVSGGKLYARLGSPVSGRSGDELRAVRSRLVCLDLDRGEGRLVWKVESGTLGDGWEFEGTPVAGDGRLYAVLRRRRPETEIHVGCFDAATGKLLWNRKLGAAIGGGGEGENAVSHLLPTLAEGRLFVSTDLGAIAALDARDGVIAWAVTYAVETDADRDTRSDPRHRGFGGCLFHAGRVFAAPADTDRLLAVNARSGAPLWQRRLRGGVRHLLGARDGALIVSGNRLWSLNPADGKVRWDLGYEEPAAWGFGRGELSTDRIYWPLPHEVLAVDLATGRIRRRIPLKTVGGGGSGNLSIVDRRLIVSEPDRVVAYGPRT